MTASPGQPPARTDLRLVEQDWLTLLLVQPLAHIGINGERLPALCRIQATDNGCRPPKGRILIRPGYQLHHCVVDHSPQPLLPVDCLACEGDVANRIELRRYFSAMPQLLLRQGLGVVQL